MNTEQISILLILAASIAMFLWGRWRHDMVALGALLASVLLGLVSADDAFLGFGHPAVITVACILILSNSLQQTGAVDLIARSLVPQTAGPIVSVAALAGLGAVLSAFMNNIGALALLMPAAIVMAGRLNMPPGKALMPLSFGSILGGMTTLIGTPPNLIVSGFRAEAGRGTFGMFDFAFVGVGVAAVGLIFIVIFSRWLVPARRAPVGSSFETEGYLTEARAPKGSKAVGLTIAEISTSLEENGAQFVGLVRDGRSFSARRDHVVEDGDIFIIQAEPESLPTALTALSLELEEDIKPQRKPKADGAEEDEAEVTLLELVVLPGSALSGRSATDIRLRSRFGINLLGVSRPGHNTMTRLRTMRIHPGDVLLLQGHQEPLNSFASLFGCVPLANRSLRIPDARRAVLALAIMGIAIAGAAFGLVPAALSFAGGALAVMALRVIPLRTVYEAIDWPVIVLLGALIPVAGAISTTGLADLMARFLIETIAQGQPVLALVIILVVAMTLSDFMNNAATAAVMCPIAIGVAQQLGLNADPFLMAVAIGASCAFLTPVGHQNNTLILGPSGFGFGDYWRLGLPLELIVIATSVPLLLLFWPL